MLLATTPGAASSSTRLVAATDRAGVYIEREGLRGWDPFDALQSPLFRLPLLRSWRPIRFAAQQAVRRAPLNLRPLLGIRKGYNPVTVGLVLEASAYLAHADAARGDDHRATADRCIDELARLRTPGWSGDCWGYDFDWEARYGRVPAGTPTVVATGLIVAALAVARSLLQTGRRTDDMIAGAGDFVVQDVPRTPGPDGAHCWSYSPLDRQQVINATMLAARTCAHAHTVTGAPELADAVRGAGRFVLQAQRPDGSWPYGLNARQQWVDNFHTGYVLDALDECAPCLGGDSATAIGRGWRFYRERFFEATCRPRYYHDRTAPTDATACAQSLLTLCRFGDVETAACAADWIIENLQCRDGHFAYRISGSRRIETPFMRWSTAYVYLGLSRVRYALHGREAP